MAFFNKMLPLALLVILLGSSGCSVYGALSGTPDPDMKQIRQGAERAQIEDQLGPSIDSESLANGRVVETYLYKTGDDASPARAIGHGVLDILTLFFWEYVGTPIEVAQGQAHELEVVYGPMGRAEKITKVK